MKTESIPRVHRGRVRHRPQWDSVIAQERHARFAAAANVCPSVFVHPLLQASVYMSEEAKEKGLKDNPIEKRREIVIPGTAIKLVFWQTKGGNTLVLKQDNGAKPGAWVFATRYPGKLSFEALVDKYERLAESYADRLAAISTDDVAQAA